MSTHLGSISTPNTSRLSFPPFCGHPFKSVSNAANANADSVPATTRIGELKQKRDWLEHRIVKADQEAQVLDRSMR
jgi:hypothetical protein